MSDLTISEVLDRAADLIAAPGAWTQSWSARDAEGFSVSPTSRLATCWCLYGAYTRAGGRGGDDGWELLKSPAIRVPIEWNDAPDRTQPEVVAKLREAAALARSQGK